MLHRWMHARPVLLKSFGAFDLCIGVIWDSSSIQFIEEEGAASVRPLSNSRWWLYSGCLSRGFNEVRTTESQMFNSLPFSITADLISTYFTILYRTCLAPHVYLKMSWCERVRALQLPYAGSELCARPSSTTSSSSWHVFCKRCWTQTLVSINQSHAAAAAAAAANGFHYFLL